MNEEKKDLIPFVIRVSEEDPDTFYYSEETDEGDAIFKLKNPINVRSGIEAEITVDLWVDGSTPKIFEGRLNILSLSNREAFSRALGKVLTKNVAWDAVLARACAALKRHLEEEDRSVSVGSVETTQSATWLLDPFLVKDAPNVLFGKGGTGKTYLALQMAQSLETGQEFLGFKPAEKGNVLFLDYEDTAEEAAKRSRALGGGNAPSNLWYFPSNGSSLHDLVPVLKRTIQKKDIKLLIIDSAVLACGGRPEEAEMAARYFNALKALKITSLTIGHETKAEAGQYPFGSVFFWNSPRNIWYIKDEQEQDERAKMIGLFHRKSNHGLLKSPVGVRMWHDPTGLVEIKRGPVSDAWNKEFTLKKRLLRYLNEGQKTLDDLRLLESGTADSTLKNALGQLKARGKIDNLGGVWMALTT